MYSLTYYIDASVLLENNQWHFPYPHYTFFRSNSEISKGISDLSKWYSDLSCEFQIFPNDNQKYPKGIQTFPNDIQIFLAEWDYCETVHVL